MPHDGRSSQIVNVDFHPQVAFHPAGIPIQCPWDIFSSTVRLDPLHPPQEQESQSNSRFPTLSSPVSLGSLQSDAQDQPLSDSITACTLNAVTERLPPPPQHQGPFSEVEHPSLDMGNACFKKRPLESSSSQDAAVADTASNAGFARNMRICTAPINIHTYSSSIRFQAYRSRGLGNILARRDSARLDQNFPMQGDASNQEDGIIEGEPPYAAPLQPHQPPIG